MSNPIIKEVAALGDNAEDVFVIHASFCPHGTGTKLTQRLACVYVENMNRSYSERFSLEKVAKQNDIPTTDYEGWYDALEIVILDDLNAFFKAKSNCVFIYWVEEGKELLLDKLQARFLELNKDDSGKTFYQIPIKQRKSIQYLLSKAGHQGPAGTELKQFIKHHNGEQLVDGFLNNGEESNHFDKQQFLPIADSVVCKVNFFIRLILKCTETATTAKKDKGASSTVDLRALTPMGLIKGMTFGSWILLVGFLGIAGSVGAWLKTITGASEEKLALENLRSKKSTDSAASASTLKVVRDSVERAEQQLDSIKNTKSKH